MEYAAGEFEYSFEDMRSGPDEKTPLKWRGDIAFGLCALGLIGGFLLPGSGVLADLLWVFSICMCFAIMMVAFSRTSAFELKGFGLLLVMAILLRILATAVSAKMILIKGGGGGLIETIGGIFGVGPAILPIIISAVGALVMIIAAFTAAGRTERAIEVQLEEVIPLKDIGVETDLNMGAIDYERARELRERVEDEQVFFVKMGGVGKLLRIDSVLGAFMIAGVCFCAVAISVVNNLADGQSLYLYSRFTAGFFVLVFVQIVCESFAMVRILSSGKLGVEDENKKVVEIYSEAAGGKEKVEVLNPDFAEIMERQESQIDINELEDDKAVAGNWDRKEASFADSSGVKSDSILSGESEVEYIDTVFDESVKDEVLETSNAEALIESDSEMKRVPEPELESESERKLEPEPVEHETSEAETGSGEAGNIIAVGHKFASKKAYYNDIAETVRELDKEDMPLLFAASNVKDMPVTVVVNTAMRLAKDSLKTLLIDLDHVRCPVMKVFDADYSMMKKGPVKTSIKNLSIWSFEGIEKLNGEQMSEIFRVAGRDFDRVMIYAPNPDMNHLAVNLVYSAATAIVFTGNLDNDEMFNLVESDFSRCRAAAVMLSPDKAIVSRESTK